MEFCLPLLTSLQTWFYGQEMMFVGTSWAVVQPFSPRFRADFVVCSMPDHNRSTCFQLSLPNATHASPMEFCLPLLTSIQTWFYGQEMFVGTIWAVVQPFSPRFRADFIACASPQSSPAFPAIMSKSTLRDTLFGIGSAWPAWSIERYLWLEFLSVSRGQTCTNSKSP